MNTITKKLFLWLAIITLIILIPFLLLVGSEIFTIKTIIPKEFTLKFYLIIGIGCLYLILVLPLVVQIIIKKLILKQIEQYLIIFKKAAEGDLLVRCESRSFDEFYDLALSFNKVMENLTDLQARVLDKEQAIKWAKREASLKEMLEKKSKELIDANKNLETRLNERTLLLDIINEINSTIDLETVLGNICKMVSKSMNIDEMCILLADDSGDSLVLQATYGMPEPEKVKNLKFKRGEGVVGHLLNTGDAFYMKDIQNEPRFLQFKGRYQAEGSMLALPVRSPQRLIGVMTFLRRDIDAFSTVNNQLLKIIASQAAMAIQNAQMYARTREMAIHDSLTSLYNRRYLSNRLAHEWERAKRFKTPLSVIMIDVDDFKVHNDKLGHLVGDEILKNIAKLLIKNVRRVDTVARYGGEEFCIILPETNIDHAAEVGSKIRAYVERNLKYSLTTPTHIPPVTLSIGVATLTNEMKSYEDLVKEADSCLLKAKEEGKNKVVVMS